MTPEEVPDELVASAQTADYGDRPGDWTRVPDAQVRRLIAGAVTAERDRIAALADRLAATAPVGGGQMPFGRIIRQAGRDAPPEPDRAVCGRCGASLARAS